MYFSSFIKLRIRNEDMTEFYCVSKGAKRVTWSRSAFFI